MSHREVLRLACVALDTEAERLYEQAQMVTRTRDRNRLLERRARLMRLSREVLEEVPRVSA